jgi:dimethylargininase
VQPVAITRDISPAFADCELTHLPRVPIDVSRARAQHQAYEEALAEAGYRVERLESAADMPDSVFVEDIAIVFEELAVITRPGAVSRRGEVPAIADALEAHRAVRRIEAPATIDGGDVLVVGRRVFVGLSSRTNREAVRQLRSLLASYGYTICEAAFEDCLHLKSAVTALNDDTLLLNPRLVNPQTFAGFEIIEVDPDEPMAANALRLRDRIIFPSAFPRTAVRLRANGFRVAAIDASELAKAEGAVTCCSLLLDGPGA